METYSIKVSVYNSGNCSIYYYAGLGKFKGVDLRKEYYSHAKAEKVVAMLQSKEYAADKVEFEIVENHIGDGGKQQVRCLIAAIKSNKRIDARIYKDSWVSGSSTIVTPITIWGMPVREIRVQLKDAKRFPLKTAQKIADEFSGIVSRISLVKNDGSCPAELVFYTKQE